MSSHGQVLAFLISQLVLSFDALLGAALAYAAFHKILRFKSNTAALSKIRASQSLLVPDLRSFLEEDKSDFTEEPIVLIRGAIEARPMPYGQSWKSLNSKVLVSEESGDKAVIIQRTQTYTYKECRGHFGWTSDLRAIIGRSWNNKASTSLRSVPFILVEGGQWPQSDCSIVNMDASRHSLPLTTVYHQSQPINALHAHSFRLCLNMKTRFNNGVPEIKSCKELPYFISDMTKDQMLLDLSFKIKMLLWSGIVLGLLSICILGYAFVRNWKRWKEWRLRQFQQSILGATDDSTSQIDVDEEAGDVPDGELCVICLMRRRRSAFIPCGHLVCCQHCAVSVQRELVPKCPICHSLVRIYAS